MAARHDPNRVIHGLDHVAHETAQGAIDVCDRFGKPASPRIRRFDELEHSHGAGNRRWPGKVKRACESSRMWVQEEDFRNGRLGCGSWLSWSWRVWRWPLTGSCGLAPFLRRIEQRDVLITSLRRAAPRRRDALGDPLLAGRLRRGPAPQEPGNRKAGRRRITWWRTSSWASPAPRSRTSLAELKALFDLVLSTAIWGPTPAFAARYERPASRERAPYEGDNPRPADRLAELRRVISPFVLRRLKSLGAGRAA